MSNATLPAGFRDVSPEAFVERRYILDVLQKNFTAYGFVPLETPAMEHLATLMGKYGDEGDQLLFRVLNSGNFLAGLSVEDLEKEASLVTSKISKKGLRYDLTLPLARYVAQYKHLLQFPFKRYQIQPVWRADRPQKGRYREFYQCDIDVVGAKSLFYEASLLSIVHEVFEALNLADIVIHVNHRLLLSAVATYLALDGEAADLYQTLDKIDKLGKEQVCALLVSRGLSSTGVARLQQILHPLPNVADEIKRLKKLFSTIPSGMRALEDMEQVFSYLAAFDEKIMQKISLTPSLARGLSYYTGTIFEVKIKEETRGSLVGGGRYDRLTEMFGHHDLPGVGLTFGLDRIYDVMKDKKKFPPNLSLSTKLLLIPMDKKAELLAIKHLVYIRSQGITAELYPTGVRLKKIFSYADKKRIHWVAVIGSEEMRTGLLSLKNMQSGAQKSYLVADLLDILKE